MLWENKHTAGEQSRHFKLLIHWALTPQKPYRFGRHREARGRVSSVCVGQPSFTCTLEADTVTSPSQTSNPIKPCPARGAEPVFTASATTGSFVILLRCIFRFLPLVTNYLIFSGISLSLLLVIFLQ